MFIIIKMEEGVTRSSVVMMIPCLIDADIKNELLPIITKVIFVYLNKCFSKDF